MKGEKLFRILGLVDDALIMEAEDERPGRKTIYKAWRQWIAVAACVVLVIGSGIWYMNNQSMVPLLSGQGGNGHAEGSAFMHYAGAILPLNAIGEAEGITASRSTHFDFAAYETESSRDLWITDSYTLTNNTAEDKSITVTYPFVSEIRDSKRLTPTLTVNGESMQTKLLIGDYTGGFTGLHGAEGSDHATYNLAQLNSWKGYQALLENGKYFKVAQGEKTFADPNVTVYTFYDVIYPKEYRAATLAMEFDLPSGARVITYGINGASFEEGSPRHQYSYFVRHNEGQKIIILGETPAEYTVQGYENGACEKQVGGITATVKTETMRLSQAVQDCLAAYRTRYGDPNAVSPLVTDQLAYRAVISMLEYTALGNNPQDRYDWMRLDDLIADSYSMKRVMYLTAQVSIPAGRSIDLESRFIKDASYDFAGAGPKENQGVMGYDMMTKLGSNLAFTEQKASLSLPQNYKIIRQNFGFDPANGINQVSLNTAQIRYYLEIRAINITGK